MFLLADTHVRAVRVCCLGALFCGIHHLCSLLLFFKMGPKRELSTEKRAQIITLHDQGLSERAISMSVSVPKTTVHDTLSRYADLQTYTSRKRSGRPRVTTPQDDRTIRRVCVKDPTASANEILVQLPALGNISARTVRRRLQNDFQLQAYHPSLKPMRSMKNVRDRIMFCKQHQHWTVADWRRVLFSDESMIRQFHSFRTFVRRPPNQRYHARYCIPTVKQCASVMIWGCISATGPGGLWFAPRGTTVNAAVYLSILEQTLQVSMADHNCTVFQHDGAPCHTARIVKEWLAEKNIPVLGKWPGSSPDLNPIENCWALLKRKVMMLKPTSAADLVCKVKKVWQEEITVDYCSSLIDSMPSRILAVLNAKGGNTRY